MTITCLVSSDAACDQNALSYAISLAQRLDVPLTALAVYPEPANVMLYATTPYMIGTDGGAINAIRNAQDKLKAECEAAFRTLCGDMSQATFKSIIGQPARFASDAAVLSEAAVFPRTAAQGTHILSDSFERVLMNARLPVVLAGEPAMKTGSVLIAWDGSGQVSRSVRLHAGLLSAFDRVIIATNPDDVKAIEGEVAAGPSGLADWLSRRDLNSETVTFDGPISAGLLEIAETTGCEMIIAGAYGSSRAGEILFGGASRGLLQTERGPALALAH
ncbi:MAG: universal stress protein [Pseudomonadota bacterium]